MKFFFPDPLKQMMGQINTTKILTTWREGGRKAGRQEKPQETQYIQANICVIKNSETEVSQISFSKGRTSL